MLTRPFIVVAVIIIVSASGCSRERDPVTFPQPKSLRGRILLQTLESSNASRGYDPVNYVLELDRGRLVRQPEPISAASLPGASFDRCIPSEAVTSPNSELRASCASGARGPALRIARIDNNSTVQMVPLRQGNVVGIAWSPDSLAIASLHRQTKTGSGLLYWIGAIFGHPPQYNDFSVTAYQLHTQEAIYIPHVLKDINNEAAIFWVDRK